MEKETSSEKITPQKTNQMPMLIILAVAVISPFVSSLVAVNSISGKLSELKPTPTTTSESEQAAEGGEAAEPRLVFYQPMEFLVNLADTEACHYLRATVSLGSRPEGQEEVKHASGGHGASKSAEPSLPLFTQVKSQEPVVRDVIISVISAYTMTTLISSKGKHELKEMIRDRLRQLLKTENLEIYFTAFTLQ